MFKFGKYKNVSSFKYHKKFLDFESIRKHGKQAYKNFKSKVFESLKLQKTWKENARVLNQKLKRILSLWEMWEIGLIFSNYM